MSPKNAPSITAKPPMAMLIGRRVWISWLIGVFLLIYAYAEVAFEHIDNISSELDNYRLVKPYFASSTACCPL
jgi:hypothetical protein